MPAMRSFPVERGLQGINYLAIFLNGLSLKGQWHFASGTNFKQTLINIDFDDPSEAEPAWREYQDGHFVGPPTT